MKLILLPICLLIAVFSSGQPTTGEVAFVGYDSDNDNLAFLALTEIPSGTVIYFSDNEWNGLPIGSGGAFNDQSEGNLTWTANTNISPGTMVEISGADSPGTITTTIGTISRSSGNFAMANNNETVYMYLGSNDQTPTTFLTAYSNKEFLNSAVGVLTNTGLTVGVNALGLANDEDIGVYEGTNICNGTIAECAATINNNTNWATDDGGGNQAADGTYPDWVNVQVNFGGTVLPVTWLYFNATTLESGTILLEWATATELNNSHFEIEWSDDGVSFDKIGSIEGHGSTNSKSVYQFLHASSKTNNYFRLKQVDLDGSTDYSETLRYSNKSLYSTEIGPNPFCNELSVRSLSSNYTIKLFYLNGQPVFEKQKAEGITKIDMSTILPGTYILQTIENSEVRTFKVVKSNQ